MFIHTVRERKISKTVENTSLAVSIFPDPILMPIIIASYQLGNLVIGITGISFILTSTLALLAATKGILIGVGRKLSNLKPVTVDYLIIIALILTAIYVYFFS